MNFFENITFRKTKSRTLTQNSSMDNSRNSSNIDGSTSSLPNISQDDQIQQLQNQIEQLNLQLNSARKEIQNLNLENTSLKNTVEELTSKNDMLKKATKILTSEAGSPDKCVPTTSTPRASSQRKSKKKEHLKQPPSHVDQEGSKTPVKPRNKGTQILETTNKPVKNKLCILSANKNNHITSIAEETFENLQICHYISPNCGLLQLIANLDKKIADFSMTDYCVILIGEKDFQQTENYVNIIIKLRETLLKIHHTNVILCVPTFKLSNYSTMFNWRIETFNNLLHLDLQTYNYATAFDSNLNLQYDFTMFSKINKKVNERGMRNIFHNLQLTLFDNTTACNALINDNVNNVEVSPSHEFFL